MTYTVATSVRTCSPAAAAQNMQINPEPEGLVSTKEFMQVQLLHGLGSEDERMGRGGRPGRVEKPGEWEEPGEQEERNEKTKGNATLAKH